MLSSQDLTTLLHRLQLDETGDYEAMTARLKAYICDPRHPPKQESTAPDDNLLTTCFAPQEYRPEVLTTSVATQTPSSWLDQKVAPCTIYSSAPVDIWALAEGYLSDDANEVEDEEETPSEAEEKEPMRLIMDAAIKASVSRWKKDKEIDDIAKGRVSKKGKEVA
jgi:hypothetical protein